MPFFQGGADTTKPSPRVLKTFEELKLWKRQLVAASEQLVAYTNGTSDLAAVLDRPLYAFPRVFDWGPEEPGGKSQGPTAALKSGFEQALGPADKMAKAPSGDVMAKLQATLSRDVHRPIKAWHDRYKKLRDEVHVELENLRKKFDASSVDLSKALKAQDKERKKEHATTVEQMQIAVNVKTEARKDLWATYCEFEERIHHNAVVLAGDAHQASGHLTKAAAAVAAAMSELAQRFANTSSNQAGGAGSPQLAHLMQRMSLNSGHPSRNLSMEGEQAMYRQESGRTQAGWTQEDPSSTMKSAPSSNFGGDSYVEVSLGGGAGRYGGSADGGQTAPGREPWPDNQSGSGSGMHSRQSSGSSSQGLPADGAAADGFVAIGTYGVPQAPAVGYPSGARPSGQPSPTTTARWYQQSGQAGGTGGTAGKGSWAGGGTANGAASSMGYTRPDLRSSGQSDASDVSLAAAAGGVPSPPGNYGMNSGTTRMTLPYTPESVESSSEIADEETPAAEKGLTSPFHRQFAH